jgi:hypothetical protein
MEITLAFQGNTITYENDAVTDASDMGHAFGDGEAGHEFCYARNWQDFIGMALHLIQQTGGVLRVNDQIIHAARLEDTDGRPVTLNTTVMLDNGVIIALSKLLT